MTDLAGSDDNGATATLEPKHIAPFIIIGGLALILALGAMGAGDWLIAVPLFALGAAELAGAAWIRRSRDRRRLLLTAANALLVAAVLAGDAIVDERGWTWTRLANACFSLVAVLYAVREFRRFQLLSAVSAGRLNAAEALAVLSRGDRIRIPVMVVLGLVVAVVMVPQSPMVTRVRKIVDGQRQPAPPVTTIERDVPGSLSSEISAEQFFGAVKRPRTDDASSPAAETVTAEELAAMVLTVTPETFDQFMADHGDRITFPRSGGPALVDDLLLTADQNSHLYQVARAAGERRSSQAKEPTWTSD